MTWVAFSDNTVWNASGEALSALPKPDPLGKVLGDEELVRQYRLKYGARAKVFPQKHKDLWFCACGALNRAEEEACHVCSQKLAALLSFDAEALKAEKDARLQKEAEEQAKAAAEKAAKAKINKKIAVIATSIICLCIAFVILLTQVIIPKQKFNKAMRLIDSGEYDAAYEMLEKLGNTEAIAASKYDRAMEYIDAQDYEAAFTFLNGLNYKDSEEQSESVLQMIKQENIGLYCSLIYNTADVGDTVFFGAYEQDNDMANGKEDIAWRILVKEDNRMLLISEYALDCKPYNTVYEDVTWETCSLRKWLNHNFMNVAFSAEEKKMIPSVHVSAHKNPKCSTDPGNATSDRIFLLSVREADYYFSSYSKAGYYFSDYDAKECEPTAYAIANGAETDNDTYLKGGTTVCNWWLRSPGTDQECATIVDIPGGFNIYASVNRDDFCVRPAMWIDIEN